MAVHIFSGNKIAVIWDFDQTLIPGYQQKPIFEHYKIDEGLFWKEVNSLPQHYLSQQGVLVSPDTAYLSHMLTYVSSNKMMGLTNKKLRDFGAKLKFYPGMPDFLSITKKSIEDNPDFKKHEIKVEHYIVSTGLRQMILGSEVAKFVDGVWACEFIETPAKPGFSGVQKNAEKEKLDNPISQVGYFLDNTTKTRAIWEINKGTNKDSNVGVNHLIAQEDRRVPIRNMLYIADGPSDIPVFSIINQYGGRTLGVYNPAQEKHFDEVNRLSKQGRVQHFSEANYSKNSATYRWIMSTLKEIAEQIVKDRDRLVIDHVGKPANHVV